MAFLFLVSDNFKLAPLFESKRQVVLSFLREMGFLEQDSDVVKLQAGCRYGHIFSFDKLNIKKEQVREVRLKLKEFLSKLDLECDVLLLSKIPSLKERGILIMDMDMTTVQIEGIDEIARVLGVYDEVAAITANAMQGHLDFASSLKLRVAKLKSQESASLVLNQVKSIMQRTQGLEVLLPMLKSRSWVRGIASGGFTQLISEIDKEYGLEVIKANTLEIIDDKFTGKVVGEIVDAKGKRQALLQALADFKINTLQSIVIGDGANDLQMIKEASLGIAYHAKPKVVQEAEYALSYSNLAAVWLLLELNHQIA